MATSTIKGEFTDWTTCNITGSYLTSGSITYCIRGKVMFFRATVKPNQAISTSLGNISIADDVGSFAQAICFSVTTGARSGGVQNIEAWTLSGEKNLRVVGAMASGTNYYFGGMAILS